MTSFSKDTPTADPTTQDTAESPPQAEETKTEVVVPPPMADPRFKSDKKLWNEAMSFATMLNYCRPDKSKTEQKFINRYLRPIGVKFDKEGNAHKRIGDAPILWSSHTDTVHSKEGMQDIVYWTDKKSGDMFLSVDDKSKSSCLGADDTAGVWIMLEMIKRKVPGWYVFHRGEECGADGSKWVAANCKEELAKIKFAVAFDRRDTKSIITYQRGTRCCSDEFAKSLAEQLGMDHKCDETGAFTDTASYVDHIAECTNISVGYYDAHCPSERVNMDYLFKLRDAICKIDVAKLVEKRKPGENTSRYPISNYSDNYSYGYSNRHWRKEENRPEGGFTGNELDCIYGYSSWMKYFEYDYVSTYWIKRKGITLPKVTKTNKKDLGVTKGWGKSTRYTRAEYLDVARLVKDNPKLIADMLEDLGVEAPYIKDYISVNGGLTLEDFYGY